MSYFNLDIQFGYPLRKRMLDDYLAIILRVNPPGARRETHNIEVLIMTRVQCWTDKPDPSFVSSILRIFAKHFQIRKETWSNKHKNAKSEISPITWPNPHFGSKKSKLYTPKCKEERVRWALVSKLIIFNWLWKLLQWFRLQKPLTMFVNQTPIASKNSVEELTLVDGLYNSHQLYNHP